MEKENLHVLTARAADCKAASETRELLNLESRSERYCASLQQPLASCK
jgi:hypothetical protein